MALVSGTEAPPRHRPRIRWEGSPLARRIVALNLVAILALAVGMLVLNPFRDALVLQRERALVAEAELVADVVEASWDGRADPSAILAELDLAGPSVAFVFDGEGRLLGTTRGRGDAAAPRATGLGVPPRRSLVADLVDRVSALPWPAPGDGGTAPLAERLVARGLAGATAVETGLVRDGGAVFAVATPVEIGGRVAGAVALTSGAGEIDALLRGQTARLLELVALAVIVSVALSLCLAATVAAPLSALAAAAREGRARDAGRVDIPDLSARRDEIGRLSVALRGMVGALYDRIDANEQFAADVAHEIRNPLASLRSAVGTLRRVEEAGRRTRLLDVIEHDVRRLDRLLGDISDASRLDRELVRAEEETFDVAALLSGLVAHHGAEARTRGISVSAELPEGGLEITGLEGRLAQVFVNLVTNAVSFCGPGDAVKVRAARRPRAVEITVEDTGPGIPEAALERIFERFYSERPEGQFGNNSGLGLAIARQIVEAHGGRIRAENVAGRATDGGGAAGARFVVTLPA